jgi:hypothetical protein
LCLQCLHSREVDMWMWMTMKLTHDTSEEAEVNDKNEDEDEEGIAGKAKAVNEEHIGMNVCADNTNEANINDTISTTMGVDTQNSTTEVMATTGVSISHDQEHASTLTIHTESSNNDNSTEKKGSKTTSTYDRKIQRLYESYMRDVDMTGEGEGKGKGKDELSNKVHCHFKYAYEKALALHRMSTLRLYGYRHTQQTKTGSEDDMEEEKNETEKE